MKEWSICSMTGVLLGIGLFFQSVSAEEPLGQFISYEIEDYGEYEDSQTDLTYVFTKGIFSSYSDSTESMVLTRQNGEEICIDTEGYSHIGEYEGSETHLWYTRDRQGQNKLLVFSPEDFWKEPEESTVRIKGVLKKYISFWMTEDKCSSTLVFVEKEDGSTGIFAEDTCCKYCEKNLFGKTAIDYVKLYEGMGISANIFEEFHVAHDYGEVPLP